MCRSASWHSASGRSGKCLVSAVLLSEPSPGIEFRDAGRVRGVCLRRVVTHRVRRQRVLDALRTASQSAPFVSIFFDYFVCFVVSCPFNSMSWVSSSTTACATTLDASAARGWGGRAGGGRIIDVLQSPEHAPRTICLRRHVVNIESLNALNTGSLTPLSSAPKVAITGGVRSKP